MECTIVPGYFQQRKISSCRLLRGGGDSSRNVDEAGKRLDSLDLHASADFFLLIEEISLLGQISTLQGQILKAAADSSQQAAQHKLLKEVNSLHEQYEAKLRSRLKRLERTGSKLAVSENLVYFIIIPCFGFVDPNSRLAPANLELGLKPKKTGN